MLRHCVLADRLSPAHMNERGEGQSGDLCQFGQAGRTFSAQQRSELPFVRMRLESIQPSQAGSERRFDFLRHAATFGEFEHSITAVIDGL